MSIRLQLPTLAAIFKLVNQKLDTLAPISLIARNVEMKDFKTTRCVMDLLDVPLLVQLLLGILVSKL